MHDEKTGQQQKRKQQPEEDEKYLIFDFASEGGLHKYINFKISELSDKSWKIIIYKVLKTMQVLYLNLICHKELDK